MTTSDRYRQTAYHEAGHAVIYLRAQPWESFDHIWIRDKTYEPQPGDCLGQVAGRRRIYWGGRNEHSLPAAEQELLVYMAGEAAGAIADPDIAFPTDHMEAWSYGGEGEEVGDGTDLGEAWRVCEGSGLGVYDHIPAVLHAVQESWEHIEAVAERLLAQRPRGGVRSLQGSIVRRMMGLRRGVWYPAWIPERLPERDLSGALSTVGGAPFGV